MSGGSLDYFYCQLNDHVGDFRDKELDELVKDLADLFHDREWFLSGDTGEGDWNEARDAFKAKWFTESGRLKRVEKYLAEISAEVRRSFGLSREYCENCEHWTAKGGSYEGKYGDCEFHKKVLMHRKDTCDKWHGKVEF